MSPLRRRALALGLVVSGLLFALAAPAALADATQSSNWAGYAVHRSGVRFSRVIGTWRQPSVTCEGSGPSYSSVWVGLGGFSLSSRALEQIGTEVDCTATGHVDLGAWFELVPAPSRAVHLRVDPGDQLSASVTIRGHRVQLALRDITRRTSFSRTVRVKQVDISSAEWIVEAPSECTSASSCQTLDLADFGTAAFTSARARSTGGHTGSISDRRWDRTRITLATGQRHFIGGPSTGAEASPSPLSSGGSAFTVSYQGPSGSPPSSSRSRQPQIAVLGGLRPGGPRLSR